MMTEERADTVGTKISDAVLAIPGQDDGVRENDLALVDAALEVAQNIIPARDVVAKVAKSLHDLSPCPRVVVPSGVAVELLIVLDKRLA
jgi:hypothetical protein